MSALLEPVLEVGPEPRSYREWFADLRRHRDVLSVLARKDFQTRYKRASFGVIWAVAVPVVQGAVMAVVFSKVIRLSSGQHFGAYVMSGVMGWAYFSSTLSSGTTAIVDGSTLADKVWFPRAVLAFVPALANAVGVVVSYAVLVALLPMLGVGYHLHLLLLVPALALLVVFATAVSLVTSALFVYFRDVRFLVMAALQVWMYLTPIVYTQDLLGPKGALLDANPMTGVVTVFHMAVLGPTHASLRPVVVTLVMTVALALAGIEAHRRHDRLFVDKL